MNEKLVKIVAVCIEQNIHFNGAIGTSYSIQDLFHVVGLKSINNLWKNAKKSLKDLDSDSLFANTNTAKAKNQQFIVDALSEVFSYKQAQLTKANAAEKLAKDRELKLATLKTLRTAKEYEKLSSMTLDEIDAEIAKV